MIRFGAIASVVSAAVALLIVGALSGDLGLVYVSIGLAALALVMLVIGVAVWRDQVFAGTASAAGRPVVADPHARVHPSPGLAPAASAQPGLAQAGPMQAGPVLAGRPAGAEDSRTRTAAASAWPARPAREPVAPQASALAEHDLPAVRERRDRTPDGRQQAAGGRRPAAAGGPGRERDTVSADWAGPESAPAGWPGLAAAPSDRPGRAAGRTTRRQQGGEPQQVERAGTAEPPGRRPASTEPWAEPHPSSDEPEPADDPTRLAHRLGIGREAGPEAESPSAWPAEATALGRMRPDLAPESATERRSAPDPLTGPRPAGSSLSRTRKPGTRGTEPEAAPARSGPTAPARPDGSAESAAPEAAPVGMPTRSPSASPVAARTDGSAAGPVDRETGGSAIAEADRAVPAATGGSPASSGASSGASPAAAAGAAEPGAAEPATPSDRNPSPSAAAAGGAVSDGVQGSTQAVTEVLVVPGIARFHQADCILIRFLGDDDLQRMSRADAEAAGCAACRACRP